MADPKGIADQLFHWGPQALLSIKDMEKVFTRLSVLGEVFMKTHFLYFHKHRKKLKKGDRHKSRVPS